MKRKTYLELQGDYKTLRSDFLSALEASGKEALVLTECTNLRVSKTTFAISIIIEKTNPDKIISKQFDLDKFVSLMTEFHDACTIEDVEYLRFMPHVEEFVREDAREILSSSYSEYYFYKQYPIAGTPYSATGFRVTRN